MRLSLVKYVKDQKGHFKGCLYAYTETSDDPLWSVGFSLCHPTDRFSKQKALHIARSRATVWPTRLDSNVVKLDNNVEKPDSNVVKVPPSLKHHLVEFMQRCTKYFKKKACVLEFKEPDCENPGFLCSTVGE